MPWSASTAPAWTLTRMNSAPTAAATASAARASFFRTFTPRCVRGSAFLTSAATTLIAATVAGSTRPGVNGASPKFSTRTASTPPSTSARASASADSTTRAIDPSQRGLPGRGRRWTMPMIVRSSRISGSLARRDEDRASTGAAPGRSGIETAHAALPLRLRRHRRLGDRRGRLLRQRRDDRGILDRSPHDVLPRACRRRAGGLRPLARRRLLRRRRHARHQRVLHPAAPPSSGYRRRGRPAYVRRVSRQVGGHAAREQRRGPEVLATRHRRVHRRALRGEPAAERRRGHAAFRHRAPANEGDAMSYETLIVDQTGPIATITLNRPEARNALDFAMRRELLTALDEIEANPAARVVILTGAGGHFCAGGDVKNMRQRHTAAEGQARVELLNRAVLRLVNFPLPTIAMVDGYAVGAGSNLALCCDLIVASDRAQFGELFCKIGLAVDGGGTWLLPRLVGMARAKELIFTGGVFVAAEALRIGLVNRVVHAADLAATTRELAEKIAAGPPLALRLDKQALNRAASSDLAAALEVEALSQGLAIASDDHREGVAAFFDKRPPKFSGA